MKIGGKLVKNGKHYEVQIPILGIYTQGRSKKDGLAMAIDAVESLIGESDFKAEAELVDESSFLLSGSTKYLMQALLKQMRLEHNLTARDVAERMGQKSVTGYLRYESGSSIPSIDKLEEIMLAIDPKNESFLKIG